MVMLGLEGMIVLGYPSRDGELEYAMETTATNGVSGLRSGCPLARSPPDVGSGLLAGDRPATLVWAKRVLRYVHELCEQQTWTETHPAIAPRSSWTARPARRRAGGLAAMVMRWRRRQVSSEWATVMAAVREHGAQLLARARPGASSSAIGLDEKAFMRASAMQPTVFRDRNRLPAPRPAH